MKKLSHLIVAIGLGLALATSAYAKSGGVPKSSKRPELAPVVLTCTAGSGGNDFTKITTKNIGSGTMAAGTKVNWTLASSGPKCKVKATKDSIITTNAVGSGETFSVFIPGAFISCQSKCSASPAK